MTETIQELKRRFYNFKGQAMVEFAFVLPILLLVVFGLLEVGRLIFIYSSITNASRNASRHTSREIRTTGNGPSKPAF